MAYSLPKKKLLSQSHCYVEAAQQVVLLGVKMIEFLRNVLLLFNFYSDETRFKAIAKGRSTVYTISFSDLSLFFTLESEKKRFLFPIAG